jgi:enoyl-CoA hydratase/carnithine racemase
VSAGPVRVERDGPLAVVTHEAPPVNLWTEAVIDGYRAALDELEGDPPRAALFRADGRVVSGGVDVNLFARIADGGEGGRLWSDLLELPRRLEALPFPTIYAAHALCLTASFELSLACDLLLAAESARFGLVERAGPARARELVYTGELFDAATLERWNVVNRVLPSDGFDAAARAFTMDLATGPTVAHAATKRIVRAALEGGVAGADAVVPEVAGALFDTEDLKGAVRSFLEHGPGKATFEGR